MHLIGWNRSDSHWWKGETSDGREGYFPANFVTYNLNTATPQPKAKQVLPLTPLSCLLQTLTNSHSLPACQQVTLTTTTLNAAPRANPAPIVSINEAHLDALLLAFQQAQPGRDINTTKVSTTPAMTFAQLETTCQQMEYVPSPPRVVILNHIVSRANVEHVGTAN